MKRSTYINAFVTKRRRKKEIHDVNQQRGSTSEILGDLAPFERSPIGGVSHIICLFHLAILGE